MSKTFKCVISEEERNALVEGKPIEGLKNNPDRGAAILEDLNEGVDVELNINPDDLSRGNLDYFICAICPDGEWSDVDYADDVIGPKGYADRTFIDLATDGWEERLKKDMQRVLDEYLAYLKAHPEKDPRKSAA